LVLDEYDHRSVIAELAKVAIKRDWKYIELRGADRSRPSSAAAAVYHGHTLDLQVGIENLFANVKGSVRRAVRKAMRSGLTAQASQSESAVREFYGLHVLTRKRHGLPPQPISFFLNIYREIIKPGLGFVVLARTDPEAAAAAGAVFFHFGKNAIYKYGASDGALQHLRPSNLVMWNGIRFLAEMGHSTLHFGRTSLDNDGLRRFKAGWGAAEEPIEYFQFDPAGGSLSGRVKTAGFHDALFRRLPSALNRFAGAILYPHLD
jgi:hypothetical protein